MRSPSVNSLALVLAALVGACSGWSASPHGVPVPRGTGGPTNPPPTGGSTQPGRTPATASDQTTSRTVCRASGIPGGYIAVDYLAWSDCPRAKDSGYNAMIILDISRKGVGSIVRMCAGQKRPAQWDPTPGDPPETTQCPHDAAERWSGPTVIEIVRVR